MCSGISFFIRISYRNTKNEQTLTFHKKFDLVFNLIKILQNINFQKYMSSWKNLNYYIETDGKQAKLEKWKNQGRKIVYNLEFPFLYAGYSRFFIDHDTSDPHIRKLIYESREFSWLG